jgi:hypothetical protein
VIGCDGVVCHPLCACAQICGTFSCSLSCASLSCVAPSARLSSCSFLACLTLLSAGSVQRKYLSHIPQPPCPALLPQQEWTTSQQLLFPCVFVLPWIWTWSMASSVHPSKSNMQSISPSAQGLLYGTCDMSKRLGQQGQQLRSYQKVGW